MHIKRGTNALDIVNITPDHIFVTFQNFHQIVGLLVIELVTNDNRAFFLLIKKSILQVIRMRFEFYLGSRYCTLPLIQRTKLDARLEFSSLINLSLF